MSPSRSSTAPRPCRLADLVDEGELREQLDHVRTLSLSRGESTWLRGNTFYGKRQMFTPEFMEWFETLRLPPYHLERVGDQYELTFEGSWPEVMLWEIPALAIIMELRSRAVLGTLGRFELQVLYARAMTKLWEKVESLRTVPDLRIADFGTRRRHSFLWQDWCVQAMREGLGDAFVGTSNCQIAKGRESEAIGTNAHELPMVYAALAESDADLQAAPYEVLADWHEEHDGNLRIILPDTYGTKGFLEDAPDWLAGVDRDPDRLSGDPATGAEAAINWWKARGEDPAEKLVIFSDGLDVDKIIELHAPIRRPGPGQLRLGHPADQRFPGADRRRRPRALQPGVQGGRGGRPGDREAERQPEQGHGAGGGDRPVQAGVRGGRAGWGGGCGLGNKLS